MGRHSLGVVLYMLGWGLESLGFPEPGCSIMFVFLFVCFFAEFGCNIVQVGLFLHSQNVVLCVLVGFCRVLV